MRIYTKHIRVIGLTKQELQGLREMIGEAEKGTMVNYAERPMGRDTFLGLSISDANATPAHGTSEPSTYNKK